MLPTVIDFETVSQLDIRKVGAWAYARHPSTRVQMMAHGPVGGPYRVWEPNNGEPWPGIDPRAGIVAHNAEFELAIWRHALPRDVDPGPLPIRALHDTAALGAAMGLPRSLEDLGAALRLTVQKDPRGKFLVSKFSTGEWDKMSHPKEWLEYRLYCQTDVVTTGDIFSKLPPLSPRERLVYELHLKINARGVRADLPRVQRLRAICLAAERLLGATPDGKVLTSPTALLKILQALGLEVEDCQSDTLWDALEEASPAAADLILRRLDIAKASTKKYQKMLDIDAGDGMMRGLYEYFGAHTSRFSGKLLQTQNFIRDCVTDIDWNVTLLDSLPDSPIDAVEFLGGPGDALRWASWMLRPMLISSPGKLFCAADYNAVEARGTAWLTGEERLLKLFREGIDPYRVMGALIYRMAPTELSKDSRERFVGKQVILGAGYGLGWRRFLAYCLAQGSTLSPNEGKTAITTYRSTYDKIPAGWREFDDMARWVMLPANWDKGRFLFGGKLIMWVVSSMLSGKRVPGSLNIRCPDGSIISYKFPRYLTIPSADPEREDQQQLTYLTPQKGSTKGANIAGLIAINLAARELAGFPVSEAQGKFYFQQLGPPELPGFRRVTTWGGKFMENIVQKICRNLLTDAMIRIDRAGYEIPLHVHDEAVPEIPDPSHKEIIKSLMAEVPDWAPGFPIGVDAWVGERFRK